jgi:4'-phosphopantetheinyl transferase
MIAPVLQAGECRVWWADPRDQSTETLTSVLSDSELERAARYRRETDRRRSLTGTWLLRTVAAAQLDMAPETIFIDRRCPDCEKPHGKPVIRTAKMSLHVSISHSADKVAVALSTAGPLGVDVEEIPTTAVDELARCALSPTERAVLQALPEEDRGAAFARVWVRKEAALKATGDGLRIPPDKVEVSGPYEQPALLKWPLKVAPSGVQIHALNPGPGYAGVVAILTDEAPITIYETYVTERVPDRVPLRAAA